MCQVVAGNQVFGDPCRGDRKFLEVSYECMKRCPANWAYEPTGESCFFLIDTPVVFTDALNDCRGREGDLTSIHSELENNFVGDMKAWAVVWIGLTDSEVEGSMESWADGSPVTYTKWKANDMQSEEYDCVGMYSKKWTWRDCSEQRRAVCRMGSQPLLSDTYPTTRWPPSSTPGRTTSSPTGQLLPFSTRNHTTATPAVRVQPVSTLSHTTSPSTAELAAAPSTMPSDPQTPSPPNPTTMPVTTASNVVTQSAPGDTTSVVSTSDAATSIPARTVQISTPNVPNSYILIDLFHYPDDYTPASSFSVNETIIAAAVVVGPFQQESPVAWSVTDHFTEQEVPFEQHSPQSILITFSWPSVFTVYASVHGNESNLAMYMNATVLPAARIQCSRRIYAGEEVWCALLCRDMLSQHSRFVITFDDSDDQGTVVQPADWSLDDLPEDLGGSVASFRGFLVSFASYTYNDTGSYNVSSEIFNTLAAQVQVEVTKRPSCITSLAIIGGSDNATQPQPYLRCSDIHISARVNIDDDCAASLTTSFEWRILTSSVDGEVVAAFELVTHSSQVIIPSHTLDIGSHDLKLQVLSVHRQSGEVVGDRKTRGWLRIEPCDLVAVIKGGVSRSHSVTSDLVVDGTSSHDPNKAQGSHGSLAFSWYCLLADSDSTYESLEEALSNFDPCFSEEGAELKSNTSKQVINAEKLLADTRMDFWLVIATEQGVSRPVQQRIAVTAGYSPEILISCLSNCDSYLDVAERLVLLATCTSCEEGHVDISFTWQYVASHSDISVDFDFVGQTLTGLHGNHLVVKPFTFASVDEAGSVVFRVEGSVGNFSTPGFTEYSIHFNAPPSPGDCSVEPREGHSIQTPFTIVCQDFVDSDQPLSFEMQVFTNFDYTGGRFITDVQGFQLYTGNEARQEDLSLPVGEKEKDFMVLIKVIVMDAFKAMTAVYLNATVYQPATQGLGDNGTELVNISSAVDLKVNTLLAEGNTGQATQLISALGSVLNSLGETDEDGEMTTQRREIREALIDNIAEIPVESMSSLKQSSAALAVITSNEKEITTDVQVKATQTLSEMSSFLKVQSQSDSEGQGTIESTGTVLVQGLSNVFSAAEVTEKLAVNGSDLAADSEDSQRQTTNQARNFTKGALSAISDIQDAVLAGKVPQEEATIITSQSLSLAVARVSKDQLTTASLAESGPGGWGGVSMPRDGGDLDGILDGVAEAAVDLQISSLKWNPFQWGQGGDTVDSSIVGIQIKTGGDTVTVGNLSSEISVYLPTKNLPSQEPLLVGITREYSASLFVNKSSLPEQGGGGSLHLVIVPQNEPLVALSICTANITINMTTCVGQISRVYVSSDQDSATVNFTWSAVNEDLQESDGILISLAEETVDLVYENDNITLSITMTTSQCIFWDDDEESWDGKGCKVGARSTRAMTHCECTHLTFFGSSLLVPPNKINLFSDAKLFLTFVDNPIVVSIVAAVLAAYVLVAVWARRKDRQDAAKAAVTILEDNDPFHHYRFNVTMVTGMRHGAGTTATVTLTLIGRSSRSEPHVLHDQSYPVLTRGSTNSFLLTTADSLGEIHAIRLWHNNAGSSPQWYVSHCIVHDLENDQRAYFICNRWMMVGGSEGMGLDYTFHAASPKELKEFRHLFTSRTVRDLRDGHLWLSVLTRPKHSNFTCLQRVSCCLSLLMCSMMTSIMFYGIPSDPADQVMDFGSFRITVKEIIIGIESSVIAFPINLLIVQIFRHVACQPPQATVKKRRHSLYQRKLAESLSSVDLTALSSRAIDVENPDIVQEKSTATMHTVKTVDEKGDTDSNRQRPDEDSKGDGIKTDSSVSSHHTHAPISCSQSSLSAVESDLFNQDGQKFVVKTLSEVMGEWNRDNTSHQVGALTHGEVEIHVEDQPVSRREVSMCVGAASSDETDQRSTVESERQSKGSIASPEKSKGLSHNYFLYSRLLQVVQSLRELPPGVFSDPDEHKQAMREAQVLVMTAFSLRTPCISAAGSSLSAFSGNNTGSRRKGLPHPFVYVAWVLVFCTVVASSYVTMLYGLKYGRQRSIEWLVSVCIATFQSIFVTQPIKVLLLAIFLSLIFKQLEPEEDFSDEIEEVEVENAGEAHQSLMERRHRDDHYRPPAKSTIDVHLRNKHLKARMYTLLWQIAIYFCFFYLLMTITYSQRDKQAYFLTKATKGLFFHNKHYRLMNDFRSFLTWADSTLLPGLLGDDRWGAEMQSTLIGGGLRLRQSRIKPSSCETHPFLQAQINDCRAPFTRETEDRAYYNGSWSQSLSNGSDLFLQQDLRHALRPSPWKYNHDTSMSMWGVTRVFPSSGYVWILGTTYEDARAALANMSDARWLDEHTRALFVEWTAYNANTNLFCVVTFLLETPASGGLLKLPEIQSVRLHRYAANHMLFIVICEVLFVVSLWGLIYREYQRLKPIGIKKYFSDRWNWLEVAIIVNCFVSIGLYVRRYLVTKLLFAEMRSSFAHYVSFRSAASADNMLCYSLAVMIILSAVKFLYLLRLNPRLYLLTAVMSDSLYEVMAFSFLLFVLIVSYACGMSLLFGSLRGYRNFVQAFITLFNSLPGNFVYADLVLVHRRFGPFMLFTFQFVGFFLFLDLLISALNESMVSIRRNPPPPSENRMLGLMLLSKLFSLLGIPQKYHIGMSLD
ncbi:polycystin-1-like protein 2 [Diadema setosum]|uniref:polycystin-1-like protein 2 n=1 Tax=Diadema setosum TaxID=31175 RepID=UPI003B3BDEC1